MPVGLTVLIRVDARLVKAALAIIIVAFSAYSSPGTTKLELKNDSRLWLVGCGFSGSILGGAYGMNGPPLVVRGAMRRWSARHFRATLQGYLLPASPHQHGRLLARWSLGAVCDALLLVVAALMVGAIFLGRALNRRLAAETFLSALTPDL